jgi:hypothetical protein
MEREAVRHYTDPLLPTWGNKRASAEAAGYSNPEDKAYEVFGRERVQNELQRVEEERVKRGEDLMRMVDKYAEDYVRALIKGASFGKDLEAINIEEVFGENLDTFDHEKGDDEKAKAINAHNRNAVSAARERRRAIEKLLAYAAGTPEQRIAVTQRRGAPEGVPLEDWEPDELKMLEQALEEEKQARLQEEESKGAIEAHVIEEEGE